MADQMDIDLPAPAPQQTKKKRFEKPPDGTVYRLRQQPELRRQFEDSNAHKVSARRGSVQPLVPFALHRHVDPETKLVSFGQLRLVY
ncbi:hypothetical protein KL930_005063 [Ogataea haglerorum]|uniref:Uncharacterized protein n=1 Tax=Ogataea haglerorum TaxID=1937702 RepID=A0AAN6HYC0_9ASCO|nr:uncharacterized protein KL911_005030 [Ogataea haglerorum]KAG7691767.1 hypothetical protein KL915_005074 [Ogataea haglerorum]KAG7692385.1 hypothetical protein KL951_004990 [Ogataea haglerorum]KAG7702544.1 hypothetical protein KL914_005204 [Ogataea haglerorum]KAG7702589.1 hypothetical protein KL950_005134 [Ogataea haglerorum]KAG7713292.1 hypothetical protein KL913_005092 [Ogataea haglerorum]